MKFILALFLAIIVALSHQAISKVGKEKLPADPDLWKDQIAIAMNKGYSIQEHFVQTEDGYILGWISNIGS